MTIHELSATHPHGERLLPSRVQYVLDVVRRHPLRAARIVTVRLTGLKCGAYGGPGPSVLADGLKGRVEVPTQRWCLKPYGHSDSCAYDHLPYQPGTRDRRAAKGY